MEVDEEEKIEKSPDEIFREQLRKFYPAVDESLTPLPRAWSSHDDGELTAYTRPRNRPKTGPKIFEIFSGFFENFSVFGIWIGWTFTIFYD